MKIGYIRVSTAGQNTARQEITMQGMDKVYIDKLSGKDTNRPQLKIMLNYVREGDTVYVDSFSRLARSTKDLLNIVEMLNKKHVRLVSMKESLDTDTPTGKFMLTIFAAMAELERETILERQREGIAAAQKAGKKFGRHFKELPENSESVMNKWRQGSLTAAETAKQLNISRTTLYRLTKKSSD